MADAAIVNRALLAAPKDYTLAANEELFLKAVRASFDGSGSVGAYLPCFQVVAPDGTVMLSAVPGAAIAAGASADVSWFPLIAGSSQTTVGPGPGCVYYVGPPSGVAAADTAAIQAAHDALPAAGGIVQLCRGTYALTSADPALSFTKPIWLQGHGRTQTILTYPSSTGVAILSTGENPVFDHFGLTNTSVATPTAGAGIHIAAGGNRSEFNRIEVDFFYDGIFKQYGNGCTFDKCTAYNNANSGIRLQNVDEVDGGDDSITNCQIASTPSVPPQRATQCGILWESGGNLRLVGNQLFGGGLAYEGGSSCGILFSVLNGVNTSDFLVVGNTVEEYAYCIAANQQGAATGKLQSFTLWGNECFKLSTTNGNCLQFVGNALHDFARISVGGNLLTGGVYGLGFGNVDSIVYGPNVYVGGGTGTFHDYGGTVGGTQVGPG